MVVTSVPSATSGARAVPTSRIAVRRSAVSLRNPGWVLLKSLWKSNPRLPGAIPMAFSVAYPGTSPAPSAVRTR
jgi:hypothetical protein